MTDSMSTRAPGASVCMALDGSKWSLACVEAILGMNILNSYQDKETKRCDVTVLALRVSTKVILVGLGVY